jgi:hypothetical protein
MPQIVIDNQSLAQQLHNIARRENRSVEEIISDLLERYQTVDRQDNNQFDPDELVRRVQLAAYERARQYWQKVGDEDLLALTDEQLDEQFWLFDPNGIPRLKSEMGSVTIPDNSLYRLGEALDRAGFKSGRSDIASRSREILHNEFADYLLDRIDRQEDDAQ